MAGTEECEHAVRLRGLCAICGVHLDEQHESFDSDNNNNEEE